jgi:O-antigen ligase
MLGACGESRVSDWGPGVSSDPPLPEAAVAAPVRVRLTPSARTLLGVAAVVVMYTNLPRYLSDTGVVGFPPALTSLIFGVAVLPLVLQGGPLARALKSPLPSWGLVYLVMVHVGFFVGSQSPVAVESVPRAWLAVASFTTFLVIYSDPAAVAAARRAVVWASLFAVGINLYELLHPGAFSHFPGRSAGLYLNPNVAGSAITYGFVIGFETLSAGARPWFALATGIGVLTTLSRSSIVIWAIAAAIFFVGGQLRPRFRDLVLAASAAGLLLAAVPAGTFSAGISILQSLGAGKGQRLGIDDSRRIFAGSSASERGRVATLAWDMFTEHPLLGNGPGATREWSEDQSTHNMYLKFLAEHGMLGLLLYPGALLAALWRIPRAHRSFAVAFSTTWLLFGLVSHNEFEILHLFVTVGLVSAFTTVTRESALARQAAGDRLTRLEDA